MAGPLTWRNVDTPDFRGSMAGFRESNDLLSNALSTLSSGLGDFRKANTAIADRDATARAIAIQDPEALKLALANGSLFSGQESASALGSIGSRVSDLIGQKSREQAVAEQGYQNSRGQQQDAAVDAFRPFSSQINQGNGTDAAFNQALSTPEGQAAFAQLTPAQQEAARKNNMSIRTGNQGILGADLGNVNRAMGNQMTAFTNNNTYTNDANDKAAESWYQQIRSRSFDSNSALENVEALRRSGADPQVLQRVLGKLQGSYGDLYAPPDKGGPTGSAISTSANGNFDASAAGTPNGNPWSRTVGNVPTGGVDLSTQPISSVLDYGKSVLIPGNRGNTQLGLPADKGSSAIGPFQIVGSTLEQYGPKVLGADWKSQPFSPENQEKIAKQIFEDNKGGDLTKQWTSLKNANPGAYKDRSWNDVRNEITAGEVSQQVPDPVAQLAASVRPAAQQTLPDGTTLSAPSRIAPAPPVQSRAIVSEIQNRSTQEAAMAGAAKALQSSWGKDNVEAVDVAKELSTGAFNGADQSTLINEINRVKQKATDLGIPINDTYAGAILKNSVEGVKGLVTDRNITPDSWWGLGNGQKINEKKLEANLALAARGGDLNLMASQLDRGDMAATVTAAEQGVAAAEARYNAIAQRANSQPAIAAQLPAAKAAVEQARAQRALAWKASQSGSNYGSIRAPQQAAPQPVAKSEAKPQQGQALSVNPGGFDLSYFRR